MLPDEHANDQSPETKTEPAQPEAHTAVSAAAGHLAVSPAQQLKNTRRDLALAITAIVLLLVVIAIMASVMTHKKASSPQASQQSSSHTTQPQQRATASPAQQVAGLKLDTAKSYGNKYANGLLPVGDGKYSTTGAKQGYVYACSAYARNLASDQGGADTRGPWFTNNNSQYDLSKKVHVRGAISWQGNITNTISGANRVVTTNDLPSGHTTGIYPIASSDPAYVYDRNPNSIKSQSLTYTLPASPTYGDPSCMGGEAGVMLTGVALFNAFDAGGRDAGAWEVQDSCGGHPEKTGEYHYHTLSSCITDIGVTKVIGFALDGFPITGPKVADNNILTTSDLDECHGMVSTITLDGKQVIMYHYVMTQDFPYSVSCFRGKAVSPPGQPQGTAAGAGQQQPPSGMAIGAPPR